MFKVGSFEKEIYYSMEKQLMNNQLEDKYSFSKVSKAADCLNSAAEIFEKARMYKEAEEIGKILQILAVGLSQNKFAEGKGLKKCNCEQESCNHKPGKCDKKAGNKKVIYVGAICDECVKTIPEKYIK